jgi:GH35 family endo-1,4-beta-xylanase
MIRFPLGKVIFGWLVIALLSASASEPELLANGSFSMDADGDRWPDRWSRPEGASEWVSGASGERHLKLISRQPGEAVVARQDIALPAGLAAIRVIGRLRPDHLVAGDKGWYVGRVSLRFTDAKGDEFGGYYVAANGKGTSAAWVPFDRRFAVPANATGVTLRAEIFRAASGSIEFDDLLVMGLTPEAAAAWKSDAHARIREHRQADLTVILKDEGGRPISGAEVAFRQRRHAYPFGTAVKGHMLVREDPGGGDQLYRDFVERFFNYVTLENDLKGPQIEKKGIEVALAAIRWARERGIDVRGHVLLWPSWKQSSEAIKAFKDNPAGLREAIDAHLTAVLGATRGQCVDWDVVNEPAVHHDLMDILGKNAVVDWYKLAAKIDPATRLYLNENNVEFRGSNLDKLRDWATFLKANGAPLGGLGWQAHMWHPTLPDPTDILSDLDTYRELGLPVQVTEYDANDRFSDEEEAKFLDDFLLAWFSHPLTAGFIMWGFKDDLIWTKNAPILREDWSLKPAGKAWMERVFKEWWTDAEKLTGTDGTARARGFLGAYDLYIRRGEDVMKADAMLGPGGTTIELRWKPNLAATGVPATLSPYQRGLLPPVVPTVSAKATEGKSASTTISCRDGVGAATTVLLGRKGEEEKRTPSGKLVLAPDSLVYLRFDLTLLKSPPAAAALELDADGPAHPGIVRVYAMSKRFVPQAGEVDGAWPESHLTSANAPGLNRAGQGEETLRVGDAAFEVVGEGRIAPETGKLRLATPLLARSVAQSLGDSLTLVLELTEGESTTFHGRPGESKAPRLVLSEAP